MLIVRKLYPIPIGNRVNYGTGVPIPLIHAPSMKTLLISTDSPGNSPSRNLPGTLRRMFSPVNYRWVNAIQGAGKWRIDRTGERVAHQADFEIDDFSVFSGLRWLNVDIFTLPTLGVAPQTRDDPLPRSMWRTMSKTGSLVSLLP